MAKSTQVKIQASGEDEVTVLTVDWEPAVFPLSGVHLGEAYYVRAIRSKDEVKRGQHYHLMGVSKDGWVTVLGARGRYPMDMFVELLNPKSPKLAPSTDSIPG